MKIAVIGTGYVGLVSGICLASKGHQVTCVDLRPEVVESLNNGIPHIYELGLEELLQEAITAGCFKATLDINHALSNNDVVIVAVGTPSENGDIDLSQIEGVAQTIGEFIRNTGRYLSIVIKSTVIPGTTDTTVRNILLKYSGKATGSFGLGMNPEFLREGNAVVDFLYPDRIVIGFEDEITKERLQEVYAPWNCEKILVNTRTAEMIKYANNTVLATLISLNNELANLAGIMGNIDYNDVIKGVSTDKRWSPIMEDGQRVTPSILSYFTPGSGFGGSCFPKDVQAIRTFGTKLGLPMILTNAVLDVNDKQSASAINLLKLKVDKLEGKKVLLLGLAFKPGTDDIRESSAIKLLNHVLDHGCEVIVTDVIVSESILSLYAGKKVTYNKKWEQEISNVDIIIIGTNWDDYRLLKTFDEEGKLDNKIIFDSKRLFAAGELSNTQYITIGYNPL